MSVGWLCSCRFCIFLCCLWCSWRSIWRRWVGGLQSETPPRMSRCLSELTIQGSCYFGSSATWLELSNSWNECTLRRLQTENHSMWRCSRSLTAELIPGCSTQMQKLGRLTAVCHRQCRKYYWLCHYWAPWVHLPCLLIIYHKILEICVVVDEHHGHFTYSNAAHRNSFSPVKACAFALAVHKFVNFTGHLCSWWLLRIVLLCLVAVSTICRRNLVYYWWIPRGLCFQCRALQLVTGLACQLQTTCNIASCFMFCLHCWNLSSQWCCLGQQSDL